MTFKNNQQVEEVIIVNHFNKKKKKLFPNNLKKKKNKQKLQLFDRRKVGWLFLIFQNFVKKASLIYFFNFFNDMSWPATQGKVKNLF
jgi:hypothetical protein